MRARFLNPVVVGQTAIAALVAIAATLAVTAFAGTGDGGAGTRATLGTAFTYQGRLESAGVPYTGTCDFGFGLYEAAAGGAPAHIDEAAATVVNGLFSVVLDFGPTAFTGAERWLEVSADCNGNEATLAPRQQVAAVPYALSLRPGAVIEGAGSGPALTIRSAGDASVELGASEDVLRILDGNGTAVLSIDETGDIAQTGAGHGTIRAGALATCLGPSSQLFRTFNHGAGTMSIADFVGPGSCTINFGFDIESQFFVGVSTITNGTTGPGRYTTIQQVVGNTVSFQVWDDDGTTAEIGAPIFVFIY